MNTCAAGALLTDRSKRGSSSGPARSGMSICSGGSSARSSVGARRRLALAGARRAPPRSPDRGPSGGRRRDAAASRGQQRNARTARFTSFRPARAGFLSMLGCISSTSRSPFLLSTATESDKPASVAVAHRRAERHYRAVDQRELARRRSNHRLQPRLRRAAGAPRQPARRPPAAHRILHGCACATPCARAHASASAADNPITVRTWPFSSSSLLTMRMHPPRYGKQAIT